MIHVAQDGSGDYKSIMEAISSIPKENKKEVQIFIHKGVYKERIEITAPYLTFLGEDAENTIITYDNYAKMLMADGMERGTFRSYSVLIDTHDFKAKKITFENNAGVGEKVGQAVALYVDGDRIYFENCRFLASQDTLFTGPLPSKEMQKNGFIGPKQYASRINGRHYYKNCFIRGDVDFIFGSASSFFEDCELFSQNIQKEVNGYVTAASTPEGQEYGYVFWNCHFTSDCQAQSVYLGRPWREFAKTVLINCRLEAHIKEEGWHDWGKTKATETIFYGEYGSYGPGVKMEKRPNWIKSIAKENVKKYEKEKVLGDWKI